MIGLSYRASGDPHRPAILLLHGFLGSSADWAEIVPALEERLYCVAPDLPGHGASLGLPPGYYTIEGTTRALLDKLGELGIERAALVGYSMGGRLALYLALRHSERCSRLFLESAAPGIDDAAEREARREADERRASALESGDYEEFLANWYGQPLFASLSRRKGLVERIIEVRRRNDPAELARSLRGMGAGSQPSLWGELAWLRVPTLAVTGELDERYARISRRMAHLNFGVRTAVVPGAGHNVRLEAPRAYLALLQDFLESI